MSAGASAAGGGRRRGRPGRGRPRGPGRAGERSGERSEGLRSGAPGAGPAGVRPRRSPGPAPLPAALLSRRVVKRPGRRGRSAARGEKRVRGPARWAEWPRRRRGGGEAQPGKGSAAAGRPPPRPVSCSPEWLSRCGGGTGVLSRAERRGRGPRSLCGSTSRPAWPGPRARASWHRSGGFQLHQRLLWPPRGTAGSAGSRASTGSGGRGTGYFIAVLIDTYLISLTLSPSSESAWLHFPKTQLC